MISFSSNIDFLLAFISAILGLSVPIMLQVIERVDQRYDSTRLAERLKSESAIKACTGCLVFAIFACAYVIFCHLPSPRDNWFMNNSADIIALASCIALIICFLWSCRIILIYYNPEKLQDRILDKYTKAKKAGQKERHFTDWVDLTKTLLQMADRRPAFKVYDTVGSEIFNSLDNADDDATDIPHYISRGITTINENLCLAKRRPFSINNGNQILKDLITFPQKLSDNGYRLLWNNLQIQLFYGQEDWIHEYWSAAVQAYDLQLAELHESFPLASDSDHITTSEDVERRRLERLRFLEFHITLCACVLREKRYVLLEKLIEYYRVSSPEFQYSLVPSTLPEVLHAFRMLDESPRLDFAIERYYPMMGMKGIVDSVMLGSIKRYLSFLYVRIFSNIGRIENTHVDYPSSLGGLKRLDDDIDYIQRILPSILANDDLMHVLSFEEKENAKKRMKDTLKDIRDEIVIKQKEYKEKSPINEDLVAGNLEEVKAIVSRSLSDYALLVNSASAACDKKSYFINGNSCFLYKNEAFQKDAGISYIGMASSISGASIDHIQHGIALVFYQKEQKRFRINSEDIFTAIDRLKIGKEFVIIAFDVYWGHYLYKKVPYFVKIRDQFSYKRIPIINLHGGPTDLVSHTLFILKRTDLPTISYIAPSEESIVKYELAKIDDQYNLFGSIVQLNTNEGLLSSVNNMSEEDAKQYSLFSVFIGAKMVWSQKAPVISIKLMYDMKDNGKAESVEDIVAFDDLFVEKNKQIGGKR